MDQDLTPQSPHGSPAQSPVEPGDSGSGLTFKDAPARELLARAIATLRPELMRSKRKLHRDAWATMEMYVTISLRVMDRTPFEEIRSVAMTEEIKARLNGRQA